MESAELEQLLSELEVDVERLRALYDQYFMGIEKLEPTEQRKLVERHFKVLRREHIRNTALRFKLNTISQRYNTFNQYWARVLREMENGTFRRDVRRAAKRFGADALSAEAKRRLGKDLVTEPPLEEIEDDDLLELDEYDEPQASKPRTAQQPVAYDLESELAELDEFFAPRPSSPGAAPARQPPREQFALLDSVFADEEADDRTNPQATVPAFATPERSRPSIPRPASPPRYAPGPVATNPVPPAHVAPPPRPSQPQASWPVARPAPVAASPSNPSQPIARQPSAPRSYPQPAAAPVPTSPRVPAPRASQPIAPKPHVPPAAAAPTPRSSQPRPAQPTTPARPAPAPARAPEPAARPSGPLSDTRIREIYQQYVQAKRQCHESTSGITEGSLAKTLQDSANKLQAQHKGRAVDFDVVIKGGKAVLKPVVKGG